MKQYWEIKSAHEDKILLFRMGDFFEMFYDDALKAAPLLNIALTQRNRKSGDETPMCGVPHHSIGEKINRLLQAGLKVAICDQIEDPKLAKGLVQRAVTRILSPGMVYDPETLDQTSFNYLCAFDNRTVAFLDASTGEAFYFNCASSIERKKLIRMLNPAELVFHPDQAGEAQGYLQEGGGTLSEYPEIQKGEGLPPSARRLLAYARGMQGEDILQTLSPFEERAFTGRMELSATTIRHLEIFETVRGERKGTLFQTINRTQTAGGARLLKQWLSFPLTSEEALKTRLNRVQHWFDRPGPLKALRSELAAMGDIPRRLGKLSHPTCHPLDLIALLKSLRKGSGVSAMLESRSQEHEQDLAEAARLTEKIEQTLVEEPPLNFKEGHIIRKGFHAELDRLAEVASHGQRELQELEAKERDLTGIATLKIRYNNVFGFYIEVTNTHKNKVPNDRYRRKQTLTNAERYVTDELDDLEKRVLIARSRRAQLELEIFEELRTEVLRSTVRLLRLAQTWSEVDVVSSLAWLALESGFVRPEFSSDGGLALSASRHPVVEASLNQPFVPNDLELGAAHCLLLTGPNMAGKSTLMRQVAIIQLLFQIGSFVPAAAARLPLVDRIFTRIGASDFLTEGLSTFMVEMQETAEMLQEATPRSLVVLDEVGRGTSTFDGLSLAHAILEYLVEKSRCLVLFATHYHELTELARRYPQVINGHMSIREHQGQIEFLHTLREGAANRSYGIHVARLAGLPKSVTQKAQKLLDRLEAEGGALSSSTPQMNLFALSDSTMDFAEEENLFDESTGLGSSNSREPIADSSFSGVTERINPAFDAICRTLSELDLSQMTPLEALNQIARWQKDLQTSPQEKLSSETVLEV